MKRRFANSVEGDYFQERIENKYVNNLDELVKLTNYLCDKFKSKNRVLLDRKC